MRRRRAREDNTKQNSDIWARPDDISHLICWLPGGSRNRKTITLKWAIRMVKTVWGGV